jgi:hypothetical protein
MWLVVAALLAGNAWSVHTQTPKRPGALRIEQIKQTL